jgi:hypothetical protein
MILVENRRPHQQSTGVLKIAELTERPLEVYMLFNLSTQLAAQPVQCLQFAAGKASGLPVTGGDDSKELAG